MVRPHLCRERETAAWSSYSSLTWCCAWRQISRKLDGRDIGVLGNWQHDIDSWGYDGWSSLHEVSVKSLGFVLVVEWFGERYRYCSGSTSNFFVCSWMQNWIHMIASRNCTEHHPVPSSGDVTSHLFAVLPFWSENARQPMGHWCVHHAPQNWSSAIQKFHGVTSSAMGGASKMNSQDQHK
jgi:hypothetical protein